jgi:uncharacterized membrane protein/nitrite reductase/ring-hydroxylating ferredoxin subunit
MRSKAHFKTHPIHPILVAFPIAFFMGTFLFDALSIILGENSFQTTAWHLNIAGIAFAIIAALPGAIDYFFTVPPKSSAKKRASQHALLNISVLIIFSIAFMLKQKENTGYLLISALELAGVILLIIAGWLGGTLVHRNQIGVDIRYANAGKWKEERHEKKDRIKVADEGELQLNQMKLVHINNKRIVIGKTEKGYVAFDDHCTHKGGSLAAGALICSTVQCPWHGSQFSTETGAVHTGPAKEGIPTYMLKAEGNAIFLEL